MSVNLQELFEQGREHHRSGRHPEAAAAFRRCLEIDPRAVAAHAALGNVLRETGKLQESTAMYQRALEIQPNHVGALNGIGNALRMLKDYDRAIVAYQQALHVDPSQFQTHHNLGIALLEKGRRRDAIAVFRHTLDLEPRSQRTYVSLLQALGDEGENAVALETARRAVKFFTKDAQLQEELGKYLFLMEQIEEAGAAFARAIELDPSMLLAHNNLGNVLRQQGKFAQAKEEFAKCLMLDPTFPAAHWNMSLLRLMDADLPGAWEQYEWRLKVPELTIKHEFDQPRWDGGDLNGRTILLHSEQGFGDAIHFARYAPLVAGRGGKVILACHPELVWLMQDVPGVSQCVPLGRVNVAFDVQCPLMSLPHVFQTTVQTVPTEIPYLRADGNRAKRWRKRMEGDDRKKIGLFWSGHKLPDQRRSARLADWSNLSQIKNVRWVSLQKGPAAVEVQSPPGGMQIDDWTIELIDFSDTAALMETLDLVITIDSAAAHLAGALGKPVWLLLPQVPTWRWMLERSDSPWYPTMRIFRQEILGDWRGPIDRVVAELQKV